MYSIQYIYNIYRDVYKKGKKKTGWVGSPSGKGSVKGSAQGKSDLHTVDIEQA